MTDDLDAHRTLRSGFTGTLRAFFYVAAATSAASAYVLWVEIGHFDTWWRERSTSAFDRLAAIEQSRVSVLGVHSLVVLAVAVLVIVWWRRAYRAVERLPVTGRSWSAGWAVGGWFLPVANLFIPKLVLNEIDRISSAAGEGTLEWRRRPLLRLTRWWWGLWIFGSAAFGYGVLAAESLAAEAQAAALDGEAYRFALWTLMLGMAALAAAALFAAASLRVLGERLAPPFNR